MVRGWRAEHLFVGDTPSSFAGSQDLWSKITHHFQLSIHILQPHHGKECLPVFRYLFFCKLLSSPCRNLPEGTSVSRLFFHMGFKIVDSHQEGRMGSKPSLNLKEPIDLLKGSLSPQTSKLPKISFEIDLPLGPRAAVIQDDTIKVSKSIQDRIDYAVMKISLKYQ